MVPEAKVYVFMKSDDVQYIVVVDNFWTYSIWTDIIWTALNLYGIRAPAPKYGPNKVPQNKADTWGRYLSSLNLFF